MTNLTEQQTDDAARLARRLRELREAAGMTQAQAAVAAGCSRMTVINLEAGRAGRTSRAASRLVTVLSDWIVRRDAFDLPNAEEADAIRKAATSRAALVA